MKLEQVFLISTTCPEEDSVVHDTLGSVPCIPGLRGHNTYIIPVTPENQLNITGIANYIASKNDTSKTNQVVQ